MEGGGEGDRMSGGAAPHEAAAPRTVGPGRRNPRRSAAWRDGGCAQQHKPALGAAQRRSVRRRERDWRSTPPPQHRAHRRRR
ncbi:hypothetical protein PSMK_11420 [Phycisphaera mikurensis NBRC 102666]|uniref:Uncharacterized protein n=1 Tax=Phycisphaera mikurensis (strain NBRC 102666 / KCTC 22515 / FYK2301M01) TaxID=1142394 RepID=I0IDG3_PHYMF|nr:hypothetical protein PSMK_11420 [Phycisphaera mikurensis NBRC 102666]